MNNPVLVLSFVIRHFVTDAITYALLNKPKFKITYTY